MPSARWNSGLVLGALGLVGCAGTTPAAPPVIAGQRPPSEMSSPSPQPSTGFPSPFPEPVRLSGDVLAPASLAGYRLQALSQSPVASSTVALFDATGKPLLDANGQPLTATTNGGGHFAFTASLPVENFIARVTLPKGALQAVVPDDQGAISHINVDLVSSLAAAYVLHVGAGQQAAVNKLSVSALSGMLTGLGQALDASDAAAPASLNASDVLATVEALKASDSALSQQLDQVATQLGGVVKGLATLSGTVYDEKGTPLDAAQVEVKSLNAGSPFDTTVVTKSGSYVVADVPAGVQLEVTATKSGFTTRSRTTTLIASHTLDLPAAASATGYAVLARRLLSTDTTNTLDFGGAGSASDPFASAYFLSDFPEVASVSPADTGSADANAGAYALTLSEPLDATNQARFASAIRVWPADAVAAPETTATPALANGIDITFPAVPMSSTWNSNGNYAIDANAAFGTNVASVAWSADGLTATLSLKAPLQTGKKPATYQFGLIEAAAPIADAAGHVLGTDKTGVLGSAPASGTPICYGFKADSAFVDASKTGDGSSPWAQTHFNASPFTVASDTAMPTLMSVSEQTVSGQSQLRLAFSRPMAAYDGNPATQGEHLASSTASLANYVFAFGGAAADVDGVALDKTPQTATAMAAVASGTAVVFAPSAVKLDVDPNDPRVVRLTASGTSDVLPTGFHALRVRVTNVQTPAGNALATPATMDGTL